MISKQETKDLIGLFKDLYQYFVRLRKKVPLAENIQFPKLSTKMSEPLAHYLIQEGVILPELKKVPIVTKGLGRSKPDLAYQKSSKSKLWRVEVKATGDKEFSRLTKGDLKADYVVWINFSDFFLTKSKDKIDIYIAKSISRKIKKEGHMTLDNYKKRLGSSLTKKTINLEKWLQKK